MNLPPTPSNPCLHTHPYPDIPSQYPPPIWFPIPKSAISVPYELGDSIIALARLCAWLSFYDVWINIFRRPDLVDLLEKYHLLDEFLCHLNIHISLVTMWAVISTYDLCDNALHLSQLVQAHGSVFQEKTEIPYIHGEHFYSPLECHTLPSSPVYQPCRTDTARWLLSTYNIWLYVERSERGSYLECSWLGHVIRSRPDIFAVPYYCIWSISWACFHVEGRPRWRIHAHMYWIRGSPPASFLIPLAPIWSGSPHRFPPISTNWVHWKFVVFMLHKQYGWQPCKLLLG